ncbi:UPF0538 protein C2orf76-like [Homarus americanus]|uniref:UPF0538 protein C2orf76-like n=1 Tax=Homarus americanus TaxID=6706 RepID=A0A8J5KDD4_HOMAM|nr:UPF0538 protein C2orf76-like [Homarus americanus]
MSGDNEVHATITIRLIRSFQHRNIRSLVLHNINTEQLVEDFIEYISEKLTSAPNLPPFHNHAFDTLKIETQAHGYKTNDPVINQQDDLKLILKPKHRLMDCGVKHETEINFFKMEDYLKYKENPELVW